ncbi:TetR/AcrR family transcriptional regulator [Streptomyces misionensis]|uniref:TetR/AcrR family transcriptional regulator n=1 Tax=Streptomyces misionensis TaxID=67331 RepID=UPI0036B9122E
MSLTRTIQVRVTVVNKQGRRRIDEIGDESRRRILDAAEELFSEFGFDSTSIAGTAERSGISRAPSRGNVPVGTGRCRRTPTCHGRGGVVAGRRRGVDAVVTGDAG